MYVHHMLKKRALGPWVLKLQVDVSYHVWVLEVEPRLSPRTVITSVPQPSTPHLPVFWLVSVSAVHSVGIKSVHHTWLPIVS